MDRHTSTQARQVQPPQVSLLYYISFFNFVDLPVGYYLHPCTHRKGTDHVIWSEVVHSTLTTHVISGFLTVGAVRGVLENKHREGNIQVWH